MSSFLLITAAGSSSRFGTAQKKEFLEIKEGETVLATCVKAFSEASRFSKIIITIPNNLEKEAEEAVFKNSSFVSSALYNSIIFVKGGSSRQESVFNGLKKIKEFALNDDDIVLIHDGARPWITSKVINDVIETTLCRNAVVPAVDVVDTQKEVNEDGKIIRHLKRSTLKAVQTPQGFNFKKLFEAHVKASSDGNEYTDDSEIWGKYAGDVFVVPGDISNKKITFRQDLDNGNK